MLIAEELQRLFSLWSAEVATSGPAKAIVVPHAGYRHSGSTAIHGYKALESAKPKRIILLGPCHRALLPSTCQATSFHAVETPLGPIKVANIALNIRCLGATPKDIDQKEHSLELQFPFIKHYCPDAEIIPILVRGSAAQDESMAYLANLLRDQDTALVISSDFCHWGADYGYYPRLQAYSGSTMSERIRSLDEQALEAIASMNPDDLLDYLEGTGNTVCGCDAILLGMRILNRIGGGTWKWLHYNQSSELGDYDPQGHSVSYVAGALIQHPEPSPIGRDRDQ